MSTKDPLLALVAEDAQTVDRSRIYEFLKPYVIIDKKSLHLAFRGSFNSVAENGRKIEIFLTAALARSLIFAEASPAMLPKDIIAAQIMPAGSVKTALRALFKDGAVKKNDDGAYYIPMYRLDELFTEYSI